MVVEGSVFKVVYFNATVGAKGRGSLLASGFVLGERTSTGPAQTGVDALRQAQVERIGTQPGQTLANMPATAPAAQ